VHVPCWMLTGSGLLLCYLVFSWIVLLGRGCWGVRGWRASLICCAIPLGGYWYMGPRCRSGFTAYGCFFLPCTLLHNRRKLSCSWPSILCLPMRWIILIRPVVAVVELLLVLLIVGCCLSRRWRVRISVSFFRCIEYSWKISGCECSLCELRVAVSKSVKNICSISWSWFCWQVVLKQLKELS